MPRKKAAAAAPAAPVSPPLDGCVLAASGSFAQYTQGDLQRFVERLGAAFAKSVTNKVTHLLVDDFDFDKDSTKAVAAKTKGVPIVTVAWLQECDAKQANVPADAFTFGKATQNGAQHSQPASQNNGSQNGGVAGRKRGTQSKADNDADADPPAKKSKKTSAALPAKSADADKKPTTQAADKKPAELQIPVDEECSLVNYIVYVDDNGMIYDATLNQANASHNNNKFYRIQVLKDVSTGDYKTWTRWGRVGDRGQSAILGFGTLDDAIGQFESKFRGKSGLKWADRTKNPLPGKYAYIEKSYEPDSDDDEADGQEPKPKTEKGDEEENANELPDCTLEKPVQDLMELIFNQQYFAATMHSLNYDANKLPLGKLSKNTILRGFQALKDLAALLDDPNSAQSQHGMTLGNATEHFSNLFYSLIPHAFGRNRPPIIRDSTMLKKEIELLESLSDMKDAADIMKIDRKAPNVHPADLQFQGLGLEEMTVLDPNGDEFGMLRDYLQGSKGQTHSYTYQIEQIFRIERQGEHERFNKSKYATIKSDKRLLWHGSRCTNFGGILSQGLRIAPPEAPVSGYMFGKGIYLADMSSKSAGYCASYISNNHALLLLCEAELGDPMQKLVSASYSAGTDAVQNGMASTWGMGTTGPKKWKDAGCVHPSLKGVKMPDLTVPASDTGVQGASLWYNEYICYDVAQVKLRYLFRVKM